MQDFRNLSVWQKSHKLTLRMYAVSATFPRPQHFNLRSPIVRCAVSVPANIAEGCGSRRSRLPSISQAFLGVGL